MDVAVAERQVARDAEGYPVPLVMTDCVIFALKLGELHLLVPKRDKAPEEGRRALVGGQLHLDEEDSPEAAARRIARQKVGIDVRYMEQLYTFGGPYRDEVWTVTIAYLALLGLDSVPDHLHPDLFPVDRLPPLAFDHDRIAAMAIARLRDKATYSSLPAYLLPSEFTIDDLRRVYEQVLGTSLNKSVFREQIVRQGFIERTGEMTTGRSHRPAQLWRLSQTTLVNFDTMVADVARANTQRRVATTSARRS